MFYFEGMRRFPRYYVFLLISFLLLGANVFAQTKYFELVYNNPNDTIASDWYKDVIEDTEDNSYLGLRWTASNLGSRSTLEKIYADSTVVHLTTIGIPGHGVIGRRVLRHKDGHIVMSRNTDFAFQRIYIGLYKIGKFGGLIDHSIYDSTKSLSGVNIEFTHDNGYIIAGTTEYADSLNRKQEVLLIKLDSNLHVEWRREIGLPASHYYTYSVSQLNDGSYVASGLILEFDDYNWYIIRVDQQGNILWDNIIRSFGRDMCYANTATKDGGFVVAGSKQIQSDPSTFDLRVIKYDSLNRLIWDSSYTHPFVKQIGARRIYEVEDRNLLVVANGAQLDKTLEKPVLALLSPQGEMLWLRQYATDDQFLPHFPKYHQYFRDITPTSDGGFVAFGSAFVRSADAWLLKLDSAGCAYPSCDTCAPILPYYGVTTHGDGVTFTFTDPNPSSVVKIWNFGDGTRDTTTAASVTHTYAGSRRYSVCLRRYNYCQELVDTCTWYDVVATGLPDAPDIGQVQLYPNPATHQLTLQWDRQQPGATLTLQNQQGQVLREEEVQQATQSIPVAQLPAGLYLAILRDRDGVILHREKVMVVR